jgi:LemA protein
MSDYSNRDSGPDLRDQFREDYARQQDEMTRTERKRSKMWMWIVGGILAFGLLFGGCGVSTYNSLQVKRERVTQSWSNIDSQLQRRADLIPNLVNTVKGYAQHEEKIFTEIADARSRLLGAQTPEAKSDANSALNSALGRLLVITENYPDLKASQQFQTLMAQLEGTENRINVARTDYNASVFEYNTSRNRFPAVVMANILGFDRAEEFKASPGARDVPNVDFTPNK